MSQENAAGLNRMSDDPGLRLRGFFATISRPGRYRYATSACCTSS